MSNYKVIAPGFIDGRLYHPEGKRNTYHRDEPFKEGETPSWMEFIEPPAEETPEELAEREAAELAEREAAELATQEAAKKKAEDDKEIKGASFMDSSGQPAATVETL